MYRIYQQMKGLSKIHFGIEDKNILLFCERLIDGPDNELTIFITMSTKIKPSTTSLEYEPDEQLRNILLNTMKLVPDYTQVYKIHFDNYIIYQNINESYASYDPTEIRLGNGLILFSKSKFLDNLNEATIAFDDGKDVYPDKFQHYGIYTLNHIIDVISHIEPNIEKVKIEDIK